MFFKLLFHLGCFLLVIKAYNGFKTVSYTTTLSRYSASTQRRSILQKNRIFYCQSDQTNNNIPDQPSTSSHEMKPEQHIHEPIEEIDPLANVTTIQLLDSNNATLIQLQKELDDLNHHVIAQRNRLIQLKDKAYEKGPQGYYLIQAQVKSFRAEKDLEQKERINSMEQDIVKRFIPIIDKFRQLPIEMVPTNEKENKVHQNFGVLLKNILVTLKRIGFSEFSPEPKDKLHAEAHQVMKLESKDGFEEGMIIETLRPGMASNDQKVILRKALVVAATTLTPTSTSSSNDNSTPELSQSTEEPQPNESNEANKTNKANDTYEKGTPIDV